MFRSKEAVKVALHNKETTVKYMKDAAARYRRKGDLELTKMFVLAVEEYLHEFRFPEEYK